MTDKLTIQKIKSILEAFKSGRLGDTTMPEDTHPEFPDLEAKRIYYTLPMALNYQRNSYKLWESAKATWKDPETREVFSIQYCSSNSPDKLRPQLIKHKLALQPNKHIDTWSRIAQTISENWGSVSELIEENDSDYLKLREILQKTFEKGFPYLSGPKIFNYWMYIMSEYGEAELKNRQFIEIAPDTHVIKASIKLGIISEAEATKLGREKISEIWRDLLEGTGIDPIDMHSPL